VGLLCDYFLAENDDEAAATIDWLGGPSTPPSPKGLLRKKKLEAPPTIHVPGVDPVVMMANLEHLLTGQNAADLIDENAQRDVAVRQNGERMVVRLSDSLIDALANSNTTQLQSVSAPWSQTEEFFGQGDPRVLAERLAELAVLARQGRQTGARLYCWMCV
jgi:hypothetical protein